MRLTKKDIINIIKNWDVGQLKNYTLLYSHWNLSYKITTTKGRFILKVLIMQKEEALKKELKILSLLPFGFNTPMLCIGQMVIRDCWSRSKKIREIPRSLLRLG